MVNEFLQEILAIVVVAAGFLVFYFILKRRSTPQIPSEEPKKHDRTKEYANDKIEAVPEIKEEPKIEPLPEISLPEKEEEFKVIPSAHEVVPEDLTSRRKSDKTIPKRSVPEHGKITKQNFSEFAGERIMVAEDNPINQKVIMGLLAGSGIDIVMANDGQEALDILENDTNFLMILMDAHMPRVDGFQATRIIRENPKYDHILVVALSGDTASDDIQKMKNAGMAEQLEKPLRMDSLYDVLYAYTGKGAEKNESAEAHSRKPLDIEKGLQTCGEDEGFYREILAEFITDYGNSSNQLGEFLRAHNLQAADALLLDIIGVTENIGAHPLAEIA
ncbi:response regulator, partial [Sulfuricurvum sp.]|uniref:response regulator n=1 Tax=Sulfuricurvum sp. TaxID=2025608 RepID=UPI002D6C65DA